MDEAEIRTLLDRYSELSSWADITRLKLEAQRKAIIPADVAAQLQDLEEEFTPIFAAIEEGRRPSRLKSKLQ